MWEYNYPDYLAHYGIKGQKWGQRNYQNLDGSLTSAGRARYNQGTGVSRGRRIASGILGGVGAAGLTVSALGGRGINSLRRAYGSSKAAARTMDRLIQRKGMVRGSAILYGKAIKRGARETGQDIANLARKGRDAAIGLGLKAESRIHNGLVKGAGIAVNLKNKTGRVFGANRVTPDSKALSLYRQTGLGAVRGASARAASARRLNNATIDEIRDRIGSAARSVGNFGRNAWSKASGAARRGFNRVTGRSNSTALSLYRPRQLPSTKVASASKRFLSSRGGKAALIGAGAAALGGAAYGIYRHNKNKKKSRRR